MPLDRTSMFHTDESASGLSTHSETVPLCAVKRLATKVLDTLLGELGRAEAMALIDWVADDATARRIEMEGDTCAARS